MNNEISNGKHEGATVNAHDIISWFKQNSVETLELMVTSADDTGRTSVNSDGTIEEPHTDDDSGNIVSPFSSESSPALKTNGFAVPEHTEHHVSDVDLDKVELANGVAKAGSFIDDNALGIASEPGMHARGNVRNSAHMEVQKPKTKSETELGSSFDSHGSVDNVSALSGSQHDLLSLWGHVWPQPREIRPHLLYPQHFTIPKLILVSLPNNKEFSHQVSDLLVKHNPSLEIAGYEIKLHDYKFSESQSHQSTIICHIDNGGLFRGEDSYKLVVTLKNIFISAGGLVGLNYAICSLLQAIRTSEKGVIPCLIMLDRPSHKYRVVCIDVSLNTNCVPRPDVLSSMVDTWSTLKASHLHLRISIDFLGDFEWPLQFSERDLICLERHCTANFIKLVPSFDLDWCSLIRFGLSCYLRLVHTINRLLKYFPSARSVEIGHALYSYLFDHACNLNAAGDDSSVNEDVFKSIQNSTTISDLLCQLFGNLTVMLSIDMSLLVDHTGLQLGNGPQGQITRFLEGVPLSVVLILPASVRDLPAVLNEVQSAGFNFILGLEAMDENSRVGNLRSIAKAFFSIPAIHHCDSCLGVAISLSSKLPATLPALIQWPTTLVALGLSWNMNTNEEMLTNALPTLLDWHVLSPFDKQYSSTDDDSSCVSLGSIIIKLGNVESMINNVDSDCDEVFENGRSPVCHHINPSVNGRLSFRDGSTRSKEDDSILQGLIINSGGSIKGFKKSNPLKVN